MLKLFFTSKQVKSDGNTEGGIEFQNFTFCDNSCGAITF